VSIFSPLRYLYLLMGVSCGYIKNVYPDADSRISTLFNSSLRLPSSLGFPELFISLAVYSLIAIGSVLASVVYYYRYLANMSIEISFELVRDFKVHSKLNLIFCTRRIKSLRHVVALHWHLRQNYIPHPPAALAIIAPPPSPPIPCYPYLFLPIPNFMFI
jgi:hypothetical protein